MPVTLPDAIATYLAADRADDLDLLGTVFTADAHVHDEDNDYHGLDEIKAWKQSAREKYQYSVEPLAVTTTGSTSKVCARLTGTFPGSPAEVTYTFTLMDDRIASLEIG